MGNSELEHKFTISFLDDVPLLAGNRYQLSFTGPDTDLAGIDGADGPRYERSRWDEPWDHGGGEWRKMVIRNPDTNRAVDVQARQELFIKALTEAGREDAFAVRIFNEVVQEQVLSMCIDSPYFWKRF